VRKDPGSLGVELRNWCEELMVEGLGELHRQGIAATLNRIDWTGFASVCIQAEDQGHRIPPEARSLDSAEVRSV
jgi:hypothetical protein